jgi:hypothetical protein
MTLELKQFQSIKKTSALAVLLLLFSCDPLAIETLKISNNTDITLTVIIEKKGGYDADIHSGYDYLAAYRDSCKLIGDTLLHTEYRLKPGKELVLYNLMTIGAIDDFDTPEEAEIILRDISDTIYFKERTVKKNCRDLNQWDSYQHNYRTGGGESVFTFNINNEDIE